MDFNDSGVCYMFSTSRVLDIALTVSGRYGIVASSGTTSSATAILLPLIDNSQYHTRVGDEGSETLTSHLYSF